jgi:hypothetical protein
MFNGDPVTLNIRFVSPMPLSGKLEFDFSGGGRPHKECLVLSNARIIKILRTHHLLETKYVAIAMNKLEEAKVDAAKTLGCNGLTHYETVMEQSRLIGEHIEQFYEHLHLRAKQFQDSQERENFDECNENGQLYELFEKDKYPMPISIADYYIRKELKVREKEEKEKAEKQKELEKQQKLAERLAIYRGGSALPANAGGQGQDDDTVSTAVSVSERYVLSIHNSSFL